MESPAPLPAPLIGRTDALLAVALLDVPVADLVQRAVELLAQALPEAGLVRHTVEPAEGPAPALPGALPVPTTEPTTSSWLVQPTAPELSDDDADFLATAVAVIGQAVDRRAREEQLGATVRHLVQAQRISKVGSYDFDVTTGTNAWSDELYRIYGREPQSFNAAYDVFLGMLHPADRAHVMEVHQQSLQTLEPYEMEERVMWPDGQVRTLASWGEIVVGPDGAPARMVGICWDITDRREMEAQLVRQSMHDHLTGLPNRTLLLDRLTQSLSRLEVHQDTVGVVLLDVDRFKVVNDSLGHDIGDELLVDLARRLGEVVRPGDTLARFGGDEFVLLCPDLGPADQAELLVATIAQTLLARAAEPFVHGGSELVVSASAGVALSSSAATSPVTLLRDADAALNRAKENGRSRVVQFEPTMRTAAVGRLDTERELRRALREHELRVHYQPVVDLGSGALEGFEALVRWAHPTRGMLAPAEFIAVAEETGLVVPLGAWVLEQACRQLTRWQATSPAAAGLRMAVNLSGVQVAEPGLAPHLLDTLRRMGTDPATVTLEITESILMGDTGEIMSVLQGLRASGIKISVDDFGTGFSSLSYLRRFPVDALKLDRSFVVGVDESADAAALAGAVLAMARALRLDCVAEGIETMPQLATLLDLGYSSAQGYLFGRAATADALDEVVAATAPFRSFVRVPRPRGADLERVSRR